MVLYRVGEWPCWLVGGNGGSKRNHAVHMAAPVPGLIMGVWAEHRIDLNTS